MKKSLGFVLVLGLALCACGKSVNKGGGQFAQTSGSSNPGAPIAAPHANGDCANPIAAPGQAPLAASALTRFPGRTWELRETVSYASRRVPGETPETAHVDAASALGARFAEEVAFQPICSRVEAESAPLAWQASVPGRISARNGAIAADVTVDETVHADGTAPVRYSGDARPACATLADLLSAESDCGGGQAFAIDETHFALYRVQLLPAENGETRSVTTRAIYALSGGAATTPVEPPKGDADPVQYD